MAEDKSNFGKIVKRAIREMWALEYEVDELQHKFADYPDHPKLNPPSLQNQPPLPPLLPPLRLLKLKYPEMKFTEIFSDEQTFVSPFNNVIVFIME